VENDVNPIDYDDLRRRFAEEIRTVLRELAAEKGMSRAEYVEFLERHHPKRRNE
jgi:hypothetical protein